MKQISSLSIFFPAFNDEKILPYLISKADSVASDVSSDYEIIVVNDGSTDETSQILSLLRKRYRMLRVLTHKKNQGYGAALLTGFRNSKKEWIFYTDGDGQYNPMELTKLVGKITSETDVVNGYKLQRNDAFPRRIIGYINNAILHILFDLPISDIDCDFRLIKKTVIDKVNLTTTSGSICLELITKLQKIGTRFQEVGVHHYKRPFGKSQFFRVSNVVKTIIDDLKIYAKSVKKV